MNTSTFTHDARHGLRLLPPVVMGYFPLGVAFGALATDAGLPHWVAPLTAAVVYGGSIEFLMITLITGGATLVTMATTAFAVNFRHVFYPLSYPRHLIRNAGGWFYGAYSLTDEVYAIVNTPHGLTNQRQLLLFQAGAHFTWFFSTLIGVFAGQAIPESFHGLDFAMAGLFTVLAIDFFRHSRQYRPLIYALAGCAVAWFLAPGAFLMVALVIFAAFCVADAVYQVKTGKAGH